jgi:phospholipase C
MMKRRDALKTIGGLAATAGVAKLLPGCGDNAGGPAQPTTVVLMMENRSYDHWLGARSMLEGKPGDGLRSDMRNNRLDGTPVAPYEATFLSSCVLDPPHGWDAWPVQSNAGANDGFVRAHEMSHAPGAVEPMQYQTRASIPASWALADAYASCDRWFCSVRGPTWPNRMYWHSGTSMGITSNRVPTDGFDWPTIHHRLDAKGIQWAYYYGNIPVVSVIDGPPLLGQVKLFDDFFRDAEAGTLPPVVYIDPAFFANDDHPSAHPYLGQGLVASIYVALANSPQWKDCLFLVTYDESGGFFDHVPPPTTADDHAASGFGQLGFRVPTIIAGPYVKPGYVSSVVYDHTSVLKHLEVKFGLEPLTARSTAANDILDVIDLDRLAAGDWAEPAAIPPIEIDYQAIGDIAACNAMSLEHPILAWADANRARLGKLDRRAHLIEYLENIGHFLDKHNAGRLVGTKRY